MNVTFRQLRAFLAVANLGGFTRAAERVGLSQSAMSVTVRELEEELGLKLLDRTTRQVRLTDAGQKLAATGARLIAELDACLVEIRDIGAQRRGRVAIACLPSITSTLMPEWLLAARTQLPHVHAILSDDAATEVLRKVRLGEIEIGITSGVDQSPDLVTSALFEDPILLVCRRDHRFARKREVPWDALQGERVVMLGSTSGSYEMLRRHLVELKVDVDVVVELAHPTSVIGMVEAGMGVSIMPSLAVPRHDHSMLIAKPLAHPSLTRTIVAVRRADRSLSPAAEGLWLLIHSLSADRKVALRKGS